MLILSLMAIFNKSNAPHYSPFYIHIFIHAALPEASLSKVNFLAELVQYYHQSATKCDKSSSVEDGSSSEAYL